MTRNAAIHDGFRTIDGIFGNCLELCGPWSKAVEQYVLDDNDITELRLCTSAGWREGSLAVLGHFPQLMGLKLYCTQRLDLQPVEHLSSLRYLDLKVPGTAMLDLGTLQDLEQYSGAWSRGNSRLEACSRLTRLCLNEGVPYIEDAIGRLKNLQRLSLLRGSARSLASFSLPHLEYLSLSCFKKLEDHAALLSMHHLRILAISESTSFQTLDIVGKCTSLTHLYLEDVGDIQSIRPLKNLHNLQELVVYGNVSIPTEEISLLRALASKHVAYQQRSKIHVDWQAEDCTPGPKYACYLPEGLTYEYDHRADW